MKRFLTNHGYCSRTMISLLSLFMVLGVISGMKMTGVAAEYTSGQNDTKETATYLSLNTVYNDNLLSKSDVDWYKFQTSSNGYIQMDFTHTVLSDGSTFWRVYLYNSDMYELTNLWVAGTGVKVSSSLLGVPSGVYYIKIEDYYYSDVSYGIKINFTSTNNWETETNNDVSTANVLNVNTQYYGALGKEGDVDYYKFSTSSNGYIQLNFDHDVLSDGSTFWRVHLYNSDMFELTSIWVSGTGGKMSTSLLGVPKGTLYIMIEKYHYSNVKYSFNVSFTSDNNWETETNNEISSADVLKVNTVYYGSLGKDGDVDYYCFSTSSEGYLQLDFSHDILSDGSTFWRVYLYNSDMFELTNIWVSGTGGKASTSLIGVPSGKYYIKIEKYHYSNVKYNIKINFTSTNNWETETNNDIETADLLSVNTQYYGSLGKEGDVDYYKFKLSSSDSITVQFAHDALKDGSTFWRVHLYNSDWTEQTSFSVSGTATNVSSDKKTLSAGTYYVVVEKYHYSNIKYGITITGTKQTTITVIYDTSGGSPANWTETANANSTYTVTKTVPTKSFKLTLKINDGTNSSDSKTVDCKFNGWGNGSNTYWSSNTYNLGTSNVTFSAKWSNPTAGSLPMADRPNYNFDGWYTAASGGTRVTESTIITQNTTIYAHWIPILIPEPGSITIGTVSGKPGDTVQVPVAVSHNPGIAGFEMQISYDAARLKLKEVKKNSAFSGNLVYSTTITWFNESEINYNGIMFYLSFEILKTAKEGNAAISISKYSAVNWKEEAVNFTLNPGKVTVQTYIPGDINNDGTVNISDLIRLLKYISGENVTVVQAALDVNGDGQKNISDLIRLLKYISGEKVEIY